MELVTLKNFVLKLGFIDQKIKKSYGNSVDINVENMNDGVKRITGTVTMKMGVSEVEIISFESYLNEKDSFLRFKSKYKVISFGGNNKLKSIGEGIYMPASYSNEIRTEDVFAIFEQEKKNILTSKGNLLVHKENGDITQVYSVSKKYTFNNGISDNFTLLNMKNQDVVDSVNSICGVKNGRK